MWQEDRLKTVQPHIIHINSSVIQRTHIRLSDIFQLSCLKNLQYFSHLGQTLLCERQNIQNSHKQGHKSANKCFSLNFKMIWMEALMSESDIIGCFQHQMLFVKLQWADALFYYRRSLISAIVAFRSFFLYCLTFEWISRDVE